MAAAHDGGDERRNSRPVTRVDNDRQMRALVQIRDSRQRQCETSMRFECPDAAFAQDHLRVSLVEDVFGGQ